MSERYTMDFHLQQKLNFGGAFFSISAKINGLIMTVKWNKKAEIFGDSCKFDSIACTVVIASSQWKIWHALWSSSCVIVLNVKLRKKK